MQEQVKEGNQVALLWPGQIEILGRKNRIKRHKSVDGIGNFEVINPTPVSYDEGIVEISAFTVEGDERVYESFLENMKPDVIHVHTMMGLHRSLLTAAKRLGIRIVFTTHDFFPICPKVTMFRDEMVCPDADSCGSCPQCNVTALSLRKIEMLQSPLYRALKDSDAVKKLRKHHRDEYLSGDSMQEGKKSFVSISSYQALRNYYKSMFEIMDFIHYNSSITKSVYDKYFGTHAGKIITITHSDIADHRKEKRFTSLLKLTYLGNQGGAKGFFYLKKVLDQLYETKKDFRLNVFFRFDSDSVELSPYIKCHDRYNYSQLENIMEHTDVVITPSVWYETFGYTVQEALSFGVPVIVSDHVGAKDIIPEGGGTVYHDAEELSKVIRSLTPERLSRMNKAILKAEPMKTEQHMCEEIIADGYQK